MCILNESFNGIDREDNVILNTACKHRYSKSMQFATCPCNEICTKQKAVG